MNQPTPDTLVIKILSRGPVDLSHSLWLRQLRSEHLPELGVRFTFDLNASDYDWLLVYDDLPTTGSHRFSVHVEELACPRENTILVTSEPSSIKLYSSTYCQQFGHILSSQEPWAIRHPQHEWWQAGLRWYYGHGKNHCLSFDHIAENPPLAKTKLISAACSSKAQRHTLHYQRLQFVRRVESIIPQMEIFGHGIRPIDDKAESLDPFRYHLAIENHISPHHWTEKLSDSFLGCTLPFYCGAPNAADYFPADSFIPIDIRQPEKAIRRIKEAIADDEYEQRLPAIMEARERVLNDHQLFPYVAKFAKKRASLAQEQRSESRSDANGQLVSRRLSRQGLGCTLSYLGERVTNQIRGTAQLWRRSA